MMALARLRTPETQAYLARQHQKGKSKREAMRNLKAGTCHRRLPPLAGFKRHSRRRDSGMRWAAGWTRLRGSESLLLYGDQDVRAPLKLAENLQAAIPTSRLVLMPGVGMGGST